MEVQFIFICWYSITTTLQTIVFKEFLEDIFSTLVYTSLILVDPLSTKHMSAANI